MAESNAPAPWWRRLLGQALSVGVQLAVSLALLGAGFVGLEKLAAMRESPSKRQSAARDPLVEVAHVRPHTGPLAIDVGGVVRPWREVRVTCEVAGKLAYKDLRARAGAHVSTGQVLFRVEARDYELALEQAKEALAQADEALAQVKVEQANVTRMIALGEEDLTLRERELARQRRLGDVSTDAAREQAERAVVAARQALTTSRNAMRTSEARVGALEAAKRQAQVHVATAELDLERCVVKAPADGRVVMIGAEAGAFVARGQELMRIEDTTRAEVRVQLRMADLQLIWTQQRVGASGAGDGGGGDGGEPPLGSDVPRTPAEVRVRVGDHVALWDAALVRLDGDGVDERTRMVPAVIEIESPGAVRSDGAAPPLLRGMWVQVRLQVQPPRPLLRLSDRALRAGGKVWLVEEGALRIRPVDVLRREGDHALVPVGGPLAAGAAVVVSPLGAPVDGMKVDVARDRGDDQTDEGPPAGAGGSK